ncbi:L,D-transpeptidase family protein [Chitinophaga japonensis]|uniref:Murein L,D-transpeptidase YcbB/YkuD n=1 Tax=Chitinophaga japonensis TaxID=104662 RepID=A0A562SIC0_CHIJA|nr:L,D-transpeptidase family protein [Chitinophaga japonensis]TWI81027.1 murein L,D-transpeptidase YcbB/YkuD [Chitinophaga japonensis]
MSYKYIICLAALWVLAACGRKKTPKQQEIVRNIRQLHEVIPENIAERLAYMADNNGMMEDSIPMLATALRYFYQQEDNTPQWSDNGTATASADSMLHLVLHAMDAGLLPACYHAGALTAAMQQVRTDSTSRKDAALWAKVDVMMTDAFMKMASHLHFGAAPRDSVTLRRDSAFTDTTLANLLQQALQQKSIAAVLGSLEPAHEGYAALKQGLLAFRERYKGLTRDTLPDVYTDTAAYRQQVLNRLVQAAFVDTTGRYGDTTLLKQGVKAFQQAFNLYPDGIAGKKTREFLNRSLYDWEVQVALNLDRWRKLPDTLPDRYLIVNIPAYDLQVVDSGAVVLHSRVIVGTPRNRTPLLNSRMTNFVMFPYWRVPYSIVFREMLPAIRRNINYLAEKNLEVIDRHGNAVDPYTIDWTKLGRGHFPYVLRQMDGEDNSLGIMKFNFMNRYSVYLHDTNNRSLFRNSYRALSHGCVRVQQWDSLAMYLVKDDTLRHMRDSVRTWLAFQEKKQVNFTRRLPIYIRYFTTVAKDDNRLVFYEDIYGEDEALRKQMGF